MADDRLADVLRHLSDDERWRAFEQELSGHLVRVYDLKPSCVRLDSTTASSYGTVSEDSLLYVGDRKMAALEAFQEMTLTLVIEPHQTRRHLTALCPEASGVGLVGVHTPMYTKLCGDSSEPP